MILDVFALFAMLFLGLGLGSVAIAVFMYVIERIQSGGRE